MTALSPEQLAALGQDAAHHKADLASGDLLTRISATVREIMQARQDVKRAEETLKERQVALRTLEEHTLPELMREAGQEKLRTVDGYEVELKEKLRASISEARLAEAIMWLVSVGYGSIVKREIKLGFGKDEDQKAAQLYDMVVEAGYSPTDKQTVHAMTLQASIKEMLEKGIDVPMELLGAYVQPIVDIKEAKRK